MSRRGGGCFEYLTHYGNNPFLFCTIGAPYDGWISVVWQTGQFQVINPYYFNPVSAAQYARVCPAASGLGGMSSAASMSLQAMQQTVMSEVSQIRGKKKWSRSKKQRRIQEVMNRYTQDAVQIVSVENQVPPPSQVLPEDALERAEGRTQPPPANP
ncbi:hypothetical protein [Marilutibacter alkalisoli]|uniref:Uncharacterized protein n=1 Tax=Marilutibacter alkalisoli TaxID=2591633 RepID=A0A514BVA0_9GAMM|nr:hypothetical protein [Lysobacter alkalisoli]QDH71333.1 hypothetical protein FKV23_15470 [Lysobacter alkalisoli]